MIETPIETTVHKVDLGEFRRLASRIRQLTVDESIPQFLIAHVSMASMFLFGPRSILRRNSPRLLTRYTRSYLSLSLSTSQRRDIFRFHHDFLVQRMDHVFISNISSDGIILWNTTHNLVRYEIVLKIDKSLHGEGDLILYFYADDVPIYDLAFSFAPADFSWRDDGPVLLVTRVQGRPNLFDAIQRATKACGNILPSHLLLSAAQGVAMALSIPILYGISSEDQLSTRWGLGRFDYDRFWNEHVSDRYGTWYRFPVPLPRKPLDGVAIAHRRRTKHKRILKDALTAHVSQSLASRLRSAL